MSQPKLNHRPIELLADFCSVKANGPWMDNPENELPARAKWIVKKAVELGFDVTVDTWYIGARPLYNIMVHGKGPLMLMAHHDINNPKSENANDNSASIVNALLLKTLSPKVPICFTDGEEFGGFGAKRLAKRMLERDMDFAPQVRTVLNLELTGRGGKYFFVGKNINERSMLSEFIGEMFDNPIYSVPFNDSVILETMGIDSCVINPLPPLTESEKSWESGYNDLNPIEYLGEHLNKKVLYLCHSKEDTVKKCSNKDMEEFITEVLYPICRKFL